MPQSSSQSEAKVRQSWSGVRIYTVGHSTRSLDEFIELLNAFDVTVLADIRTYPGSRRYPHFNREALEAALSARDISYAHLPRLGGRRKARKDSPNTAWRNEQFRGYADHMLTEEFEAGLEELAQLLSRGQVALMCAEAVPWRCHRFLVSDVLTVRGARVEHITAVGRSSVHALRSFARVHGAQVLYPGESTS